MAEKRTVKVALNAENVDKFYELYNDTALTWALDMLLEKFIEAHEVSPQDVAAVGARELKRLMLGGKNDSVSDV